MNTKMVSQAVLHLPLMNPKMVTQAIPHPIRMNPKGAPAQFPTWLAAIQRDSKSRKKVVDFGQWGGVLSPSAMDL